MSSIVCVRPVIYGKVFAEVNHMTKKRKPAVPQPDTRFIGPALPPLTITERPPMIGIPSYVPPDIEEMLPSKAVPDVPNVAMSSDPIPGYPDFQPKNGVQKWLIDHLFFGKPAIDNSSNMTLPTGDPFSLFLMGLLCQQSYLPNDTVPEEFQRPLPAWTTTRTVFGELDGKYYDVWRGNRGLSIIVIPGNFRLETWLQNAAPWFVTTDYLPTGVKMWTGFAALSAAYFEAVGTYIAEQAELGQRFVLAGHSVGGFIAQVIAARANLAWTSLHGSSNLAVKAVYSFGAPAGLQFGTTPGAMFTGVNHLRVTLSEDAVPNLTQIAFKEANGGDIVESLRLNFFPSTAARHVQKRTQELARSDTAWRWVQYFTGARVADPQSLRLWRHLASTHAMKLYTRELMKLCQQTGDTPNDAFVPSVYAYRAMSAGIGE